MKLKKSFYNRPTLRVAQELLGKYLVYRIGKKKIIGKIVETEAYVGPQDRASHASRGRTPRTELMFGPAGHTYIYLIYGMYYCFNIVTEAKDYPAAVLIRALEPIIPQTPFNHRQGGAGKGAKNPPLLVGGISNGPGKLCRYLKIDKKLNGADLTGNIIWVEDRKEKILPREIARAKRIGIDYAGQWQKKKWRFYIKNNNFVSRI